MTPLSTCNCFFLDCMYLQKTSYPGSRDTECKIEHKSRVSFKMTVKETHLIFKSRLKYFD